MLPFWVTAILVVEGEGKVSFIFRGTIVALIYIDLELLPEEQ